MVNDGGTIWIVTFAYVHSEHVVTIPEIHQLGLMLAVTLSASLLLTGNRAKKARLSR